MEIYIRKLNWIHKQFQSTLNSQNACYHSVQSLMSLSLLSKNIEIEIYGITLLFVVLYGCETWSFTLRKKHMLIVFENRTLKKIIASKNDEV
jgi:hypothetical protein